MTRREITIERLNRGLSIRDAAAQIGVSRTTLARFEGGVDLHPASVKKIADWLGVRATDIQEPA